MLGFLWVSSSLVGTRRGTVAHSKARGGPSYRSLSLPKRLEDTTFLNQTELDRINHELERLSLEQVLHWIYSVVIQTDDEKTTAHHPLVDVTSFGPSGMVILHLLDQLGYTDRVPVITIDTLHLFPETYEFIRLFQATDKPGKVSLSRQDTNGDDDNGFVLPLLHIYQPKEYTTKASFDAKFGSDLYETNPDKYTYHSKVEPMLRALEDHHAKVWITGRRRSQGYERSKVPILELDGGSPVDSQNDGTAKRWKLNPLAYWSYNEVWDYLREHQVPVNPLHEIGYKSIGDTMTTQPVDRAAEERSGRFVGMDRTECGIHASAAKIEEMQKGAVARVTTPQAKDAKSKTDQQAVTRVQQTKKKRERLPCTNCLELDPKSFLELLETGTKDILIEFYSPYCGHCVHYAPTYDDISLELQKHSSLIQVARYDVFTHKVPKEAKEQGFEVRGTPTLYLVRRPRQKDSSKFVAERLQGGRSKSAVLEWVNKNSLASGSS